MLSLEQHGRGYVVVQDGLAQSNSPLSFADAVRQMRALQVAERISAHNAAVPRHGQVGRGLVRHLRNLAVRIGRDQLQRKLGLHHVQNVSKALSLLSKRHKGVADEDLALSRAAKDVYRRPEDRRLPGYRRDLSTPEVSVYQPPGRARPIVSFRGSVNRDDALTDAHLALGRLGDTGRWRRTRAHVERIAPELGDFDVTGHSLGGTLAQKVHDMKDARGERLAGEGRLVAFNPGATVLGTAPGKDGRVYSVHGDAVSALGHLTHGDIRVLPGNGDLLTSHYHDGNFD